jgi:hypothetical protein
VLVGPANLAVVKAGLLDPGRPHHLHRRHAGQPGRRVRAQDRRQQQQAVPANLNGLVDAGVLGGGEPPIVAALAGASRHSGGISPPSQAGATTARASQAARRSR